MLRVLSASQRALTGAALVLLALAAVVVEGCAALSGFSDLEKVDCVGDRCVDASAETLSGDTGTSSDADDAKDAPDGSLADGEDASDGIGDVSETADSADSPDSPDAPIDSGDIDALDTGLDTSVLDSSTDTGTPVDTGPTDTGSCGTPVTHLNCMGTGCGTLGQKYTLSGSPPDDACRPLGTPGSPSTYSAAMASAALSAWPSGGVVTTISCGGFSATCKAAVGFAAVWTYQGSAAGHVLYSTTKCGASLCCCPTTSDPTWN